MTTFLVTVLGRNLTSIQFCGILMHSSLAMTTEGVSPGLAAIKFWTRSKFKGCNALRKTIYPAQVEADHRSACHVTAPGDRQVGLVCPAVEDRNIPQVTHIWMQG
ncbi:hypothetical protein [Massilia violaceinigra]|uniref:hypothetical protein n=1 Tax=Massilia violaceinigra TaxID=2045208 RepID=UPI001ABFD7AB|nr:hypothetical protein [Massilia violaceinigra]